MDQVRVVVVSWSLVGVVGVVARRVFLVGVRVWISKRGGSADGALAADPGGGGVGVDAERGDSAEGLGAVGGARGGCGGEGGPETQVDEGDRGAQRVDAHRGQATAASSPRRA